MSAREHICGRHDPGILSCWVNCDCRCTPCCFEASEYHRALYRGERRNVPADQVRPLLEQLRAAGLEQQQIAAEVGTARQVIGRIERGRVQTVRRATAEAIRAVHREHVDPAPVAIDSRPLVAAIRATGRSIRSMFPDPAECKAFYRAEKTGRISDVVADRWSIRLLGEPLELIYGTTAYDQEYACA